MLGVICLGRGQKRRWADDVKRLGTRRSVVEWLASEWRSGMGKCDVSGLSCICVRHRPNR